MRFHPRWLTPIDSYWWQMDWPVNLAYVHFFFSFDAAPEYETLLAGLEQQMLVHARFRSRIKRDWRSLTRPAWRVDPDFNLRNHVHRIGVPSPGDAAALLTLLGDLASRPLALQNAPWELYVIDGFSLNGVDRAGLFGRIHHCLADGVALMQLLAALAEMPSSPVGGRSGDWRKKDPAAHDESCAWFLQPIHQTKRVVGAGTTGLLSAAAAARLILNKADSQSSLKRPLSVRKRLAWTDAIELAEIKRIGAASGATCNDVLVSLACGALHRYLDLHDAPVGRLTLRPYMPVNLRHPDDAQGMGNGFGLLMPNLPIYAADPLERLARVHAALAAVKTGKQGIGTYFTMTALGVLPKTLQHGFMDFMRAKSSLVFTNLVGPPEVCTLADRRIDDMVFWAPAAGLMPLSFSAFSYAGRIRLGILSDASIVEDPTCLADGIGAEWTTLCQAVAMAQTRQNVGQTNGKPQDRVSEISADRHAIVY